MGREHGSRPASTSWSTWSSSTGRCSPATPRELSGGQQQRVGVARALAADPPILLMDEPYSAVDPIVRARLQDELVELHERVGTTIVLVTHDIDEAIKVGDRIAMMAVGGRPRPVRRARPTFWPRPASTFVEEFLGGERTLAPPRAGPAFPRSSSTAPPLDGTDLPSVDCDRSAREALDLLLATGASARRRDPGRHRARLGHPRDAQPVRRRRRPLPSRTAG